MENKEVYTLLGGISADIKHILSKLEDNNDRMNSHSKRIGTLEAFKWRLTGICVGLSTVASYAVKFVT